MNRPWILSFWISILHFPMASLCYAKETSFGNPNSSAPRITNFITVGVIPFQGLENTPKKRESYQKSFSKAVVTSKRFRVLNDDLVAAMWETKEGRGELKKEFELDGFVALAATEKNDQVILKCHLLDANMNVLLVESEIITQERFDRASESHDQETIQDLVYRLINRLPIDISITSIQGSFITLSGGIEQSLQVGDQISIVRVRLKSLHPANKTWLDFYRQPQGTARIIEVKNQSSIAKITNQIFDGAVEVGDGAKLPTIAARQKFASTQSSQTFKDSPGQDPIIVPPLMIDEPKTAAAQAPANPPKKDKIKEADTPPSPQSQETASSSPKANKEATQEPPPVNEDHEEESVWDSFSEEASSHKILEAITLYGGPFWWSVKGPTNSSGKVPLYLFNHIGAKVTRTMFYKFKLAFGGGGFFGQTPHSNYIGYESSAQLFWEDYFPGDFMSYWHIGGASTFSGLNVSKGGYGGGDWLRSGVLGGVGGFFNVGEPATRLDWFSDFVLMPLNIGRLGYNGSFKQVESSLGWSLSIGAFLWAPPDEVQFGGMIALSDERQTLKNGRRPHLKDYSIKALVRMNL